MSNSKIHMSIFFAGSSSGLPDRKAIYEQIANHFETLGHEILPSWIVRILRDTDEPKLNNPERVLEEQQSLLRSADLMVVECTNPSFGIGFLMHQALQERIPILCLYPSGSDSTDLSDMIAGNSSSLMYLKQYTETNINSVITRFCEEDNSDDLHKFNFIASREVLDFIEEGSARTATSKSEFLRNEITRVIRAHNK